MADSRTPPPSTASIAVRVDPAASPGDVVRALARLLRRLRDRQATDYLDADALRSLGIDPEAVDRLLRASPFSGNDGRCIVEGSRLRDLLEQLETEGLEFKRSSPFTAVVGGIYHVRSLEIGFVSNTTSLTSHEVDWDKVPADENGVKTIGVGDAPLAFTIDCGGLGRVEAEEFLRAETDLIVLNAANDEGNPTFGQVMERVRLKRLVKQLPIGEGIWEFGPEHEWSGTAGELELRGNGAGIIVVEDSPCSRKGCSDNLRKYAADLLKLADKVQAAGF
jgi:hypothetical protein